MQELPEDLKQELESLGEGKQYTVEEEDGTTTTYIKPIVMPTLITTWAKRSARTPPQRSFALMSVVCCITRKIALKR